MSTKENLVCPSCGVQIERYKNPIPTVDIIIEIHGEIILIERKNPPFGWALPGGFVDYGESIEKAAVREAQEETSLDVELMGLLGVYSEPDRDPRFHTVTTVFVARAEGEPKAGDDAKHVGLFREDALPKELAFDHAVILKDYLRWKAGKRDCIKIA